MSDAHLRRNWVVIQRMAMPDEDIKAPERGLYVPHSFGANVTRAQLRGEPLGRSAFANKKSSKKGAKKQTEHGCL